MKKIKLKDHIDRMLVNKIILKIFKNGEEFTFEFHGKDLPSDFDVLSFDGECECTHSIEEELEKDIKMIGKEVISEFDKLNSELENNCRIITDIDSELDSDFDQMILKKSDDGFKVFLTKEV